MSRLVEWDQQLFVWLNGHHTEFWDGVWVTITEKQTWYPLYALLIVYLLWKHRWQGLMAVLVLILAVVTADQLTSGLMKPFFGRLRPCQEPALQGLIHVLKCGGRFGFASSHAANSFAVALFAGTLLRPQGRWVFWLWMLWAAAVSYSRIYVGAHYPADILVGACVGMVCASLGLWLYRRWAKAAFA